MKRVLAVLHTEAEPLGALREPLGQSGLDVEVRLAPEGLPESPSRYSGLVVMGGPMGVYEAESFPFLAAELALIRAALRENLPILGVCLGCQLLACAAGGRVHRGPAPEVGWLPVRRVAEDEWLQGWPQTLEPLQLHGDTFELPQGGELLASSRSYANQAFRIGSGLGLQFHVEATAEMARDWLSTGLPEGWRVPEGDVERSECAAARVVPLAVSLAQRFADAVRARSS